MEPKTYQDDHGMYFDVCELDYVKCDDDERVINIDQGFPKGGYAL